MCAGQQETLAMREVCDISLTALPDCPRRCVYGDNVLKGTQGCAAALACVWEADCSDGSWQLHWQLLALCTQGLLLVHLQGPPLALNTPVNKDLSAYVL